MERKQGPGKEKHRDGTEKKTDKMRGGVKKDRSMNKDLLLAEIEQLPNQLCVSGPAVSLQGIPHQEPIKERV